MYAAYSIMFYTPLDFSLLLLYYERYFKYWRKALNHFQQPISITIFSKFIIFLFLMLFIETALSHTGNSTSLNPFLIPATRTAYSPCSEIYNNFPYYTVEYLLVFSTSSIFPVSSFSLSESFVSRLSVSPLDCRLCLLFLIVPRHPQLSREFSFSHFAACNVSFSSFIDKALFVMIFRVLQLPFSPLLLFFY